MSHLRLIPQIRETGDPKLGVNPVQEAGNKKQEED